MWTWGCVPFTVSTIKTATVLPRETSQLDSGWVCINIGKVNATGDAISKTSFDLNGWLPATVPGTVLTTLLNDKLIPDPFFGMNNEKIPDIYEKGRNYYTYWFVKNFREKAPSDGEEVWLKFRGVNYGCDVYLNGHKLNERTHYGMFLRQTYNVTTLLSSNGNNRLAVIVYPPDPVGNPNGGQGGDGTIARSVTNQYVAGWDWIQPVHDRNTGIWDKVTIVRTNRVYLEYPHVVTIVPGKRFPGRAQEPAIVKASIRVENPTGSQVSGAVRYILDGIVAAKEVVVPPHTTVKVQLPDYLFKHPKLWWPNGYGRQALYKTEFQFVGSDGVVLDKKEVTIGIRQIGTKWNTRTSSREVLVNGQRIFIKGGNWIVSDEMLCLSKKRYDAEIHFQRDMNLNLLRVWGGGITERPEFYEACDKYGLLVMQDFWMSGDCNGRWLDPMKKDNQWIRREYPDDHKLFLESVADQIRMLRNHPSLAFYTGGNEITPPTDILHTMQDSLLPDLDSTRYFFLYSNVDSMSHNFIGGNGDGPYHIEPTEYFWKQRSFPFNSEVGSVGMGDYRSLERFIPPEDLRIPDSSWSRLDSVWRYHRYLGYGRHIDAYGQPTSLRDFAEKAQLVNYNQYRALMEGHLAHMWSWYTGVIIWKTQNPWTALRGQMYDYYLDPNAGLYGLHHADELLHPMYDPTDGMATVVNQTFEPYHDLMLQVRGISISGEDSILTQWLVDLSPTSVQKFIPLKRAVDKLFAARGGFLDLRLLSAPGKIISENLYWLPDSSGVYSGLDEMGKANVVASAQELNDRRIEVTLENPAGGPLAFFNRISLIDSTTRERILPVFYSDNYISVLPGERKTIFINYRSGEDISDAMVCVSGWNVERRYVPIEKETPH